MKVAVICPNVPSPTGGGVAMVNWAVIYELKARGHVVDCFVPHPDPSQVDEHNPPPDYGAFYRYFNASVTAFQSGMTPDIFRTKIANTLNSPYDVAFCYTVGASYYALELGCPIVCSLVDLDWLVPIYRAQYDNRDQPLTYPMISGLHQNSQQIKESSVEILKRSTTVIEHAKHHADWLNQIGKVPTEYLPMPIIDPFFPGWSRTFPTPERITADEKGYKYRPTRVIMAGHLHGIATLSGLYYLAESILPRLPIDQFDFHIFGADAQLPRLIDRFKPYPEVTFEGFVQDIGREILNSDIFFVPTPIDLGFRTRIVEAWAHSIPVVAHSANLFGMPEADSGVNILAGDNPEALIVLLQGLRDNPDLRQEIGSNGRATYEAHYRGSESRVVDRIEQAILRGGQTPGYTNTSQREDGTLVVKQEFQV